MSRAIVVLRPEPGNSATVAAIRGEIFIGLVALMSLGRSLPLAMEPPRR